MKKTKCPRCKGTGAVDLSPKLAAVLALVPKGSVSDATLVTLNFAGAVATDIAERLGLKPTAVNNRLEALRAMGLVDRYELATGWRYFQPKQKDEPTIPKSRKPKRR